MKTILPRLFLRPSFSNILAVAILALAIGWFAPRASAATQDNWRYCRKCHVMFFNGFPTKGRCPTGGAHLAQGFNFILPYNVSQTASAQAAWRFCNKCDAMFFDGYAQKGACPAGGGHVAQGFNFVLPHDTPARGVTQANWRYCDKCHAMFYDGYAEKGRCPSGGGHHAQGYNFVLRYHGNLEGDVELHPANG